MATFDGSSPRLRTIEVTSSVFTADGFDGDTVLLDLKGRAALLVFWRADVVGGTIAPASASLSIAAYLDVGLVEAAGVPFLQLDADTALDQQMVGAQAAGGVPQVWLDLVDFGGGPDTVQWKITVTYWEFS
jgi:hypothetical protein